MTISLSKFGDMLSSRQAGKEAYSAFASMLNSVGETETVVIDFSGVETFTPSWGDEFLTPLLKRFGARLSCIHAENPSVQMTLETLEDVHHMGFQKLTRNTYE